LLLVEVLEPLMVVGVARVDLGLARVCLLPLERLIPLQLAPEALALDIWALTQRVQILFSLPLLQPAAAVEEMSQQTTAMGRVLANLVVLVAAVGITMALAQAWVMFPLYLQVRGITDVAPLQLENAEAAVVLVALPQQILLMVEMVEMELHQPSPARQ
jgi:hypothetical protein